MSVFRDAEWQRKYPVMLRGYCQDTLAGLGEYLVRYGWVARDHLIPMFEGTTDSLMIQFQVRYQQHQTTGGYFLRHHVPLMGRSSQHDAVMLCSATDIVAHRCNGAVTCDYIEETLRKAKCTTKAVMVIRDDKPTLIRMVFYVFMTGNSGCKRVCERTGQLAELLLSQVFSKDGAIAMLNEHSSGTMYTLMHGLEHCYKTQIDDGVSLDFAKHIRALIYCPYHLCFIIRGGRSASRNLISVCRLHYGVTFFRYSFTILEGTIIPDYPDGGKVKPDFVVFTYIHGGRGPIKLNRHLSTEDLKSIVENVRDVKRKRKTVVAVKVEPPKTRDFRSGIGRMPAVKWRGFEEVAPPQAHGLYQAKRPKYLQVKLESFD